jgi:LysM repeat protein
MSSQNDNVDDFWSGQQDWTDSHPRQRNTGHTPLGRRLKTGVQSVFDAGTSAARAHGETDATPVVDSVSHVAGDLDFDLTPEPDSVRRTGDGLSIGELAQPYEADVHKATQPITEPIPRVSVGVVTPPSNHSLDLDEPEAVGDPAPSVTDDYSGLAVDTAPWDDDWDPAGPADTGRGGVDPLLAKLGVLAVVLTLVAGFFVSTRGGGSGDSISTAETATTLAADSSVDSKPQATGENTTAKQGDKADAGDAAAADASTGGSNQVAEKATGAETPAAETPAAEVEAAESTAAAVEAAEVETVESAAAEVAETRAAEVAETRAAEVACGSEYEVVQGDYWLRLAEGSGVSLNELLSANGAATGTPLYPGSTICLPEGAVTPPPPPAPSTAAPAAGSASNKSSSTEAPSVPATAPATTAPPTTKAPATTAPPTTKAPATTAPPTTAVPASASEVERIIREIFPASQHEKALAVAWRESNHRPEVDNGWCCYGLFQIYYTVHQDWLRSFGVNQASDLYDARTNTIVAYELYQRAGGWGPWGG